MSNGLKSVNPHGILNWPKDIIGYGGATNTNIIIVNKPWRMQQNRRNLTKYTGREVYLELGQNTN